MERQVEAQLANMTFKAFFINGPTQHPRREIGSYQGPHTQAAAARGIKSFHRGHKRLLRLVMHSRLHDTPHCATLPSTPRQASSAVVAGKLGVDRFCTAEMLVSFVLVLGDVGPSYLYVPRCSSFLTSSPPRAPTGQGTVHPKLHGVLAKMGYPTGHPSQTRAYRAQDHFRITIQGLRPARRPTAREFSSKVQGQTGAVGHVGPY